jgi:hypothetical protein
MYIDSDWAGGMIDTKIYSLLSEELALVMRVRGWAVFSA